MIDKIQFLPISIVSAVDHASMQVKAEIENKIYIDDEANLIIDNNGPGSFSVTVSNIADYEIENLHGCVGDIIERNIKYIKFGG